MQVHKEQRHKGTKAKRNRGTEQLRIAYRTYIKHHSLMNKFDSGLLALSPCHSVAYDMHTEMSSSPTGVSCSPSGKHIGIITDYQTIVNKKMPKMHFFWPYLSIAEGSITKKSTFIPVIVVGLSIVPLHVRELCCKD